MYRDKTEVVHLSLSKAENNLSIFSLPTLILNIILKSDFSIYVGLLLLSPLQSLERNK